MPKYPKRISVSLSADEHKALQIVTKLTGESMSGMSRRLLGAAIVELGRELQGG